MKRLLKWMLLATALLAVLALGSAWFLMRTQAGASWAIDLAKARLPGTLIAGEPEGNFSSGLVISELDFEWDGLSVQSERVALSFTPRLFPLAVRIHFLELQNLQVQLAEPSGEVEESELPASLALPFPVELEQFVLDGLTILDAAGQSLFQAGRLSTRVTAVAASCATNCWMAPTE